MVIVPFRGPKIQDERFFSVIPEDRRSQHGAFHAMGLVPLQDHQGRTASAPAGVEVLRHAVKEILHFAG